ncbi:hypothetical protein BU23DRAFT_2633 [Bimuria novae-zelandiae CBS 107.79]|uniref:Uncharacterized protein n=1 Tax=Bimuria novae-zelandiae CBS 107.79 TaxID=1447943 RepID=A0A6A5VS85_9PLEO|nr:hypothetical protein BU23DRAFT_2633 [Bimuria novae-zelandiae CBS 107.79]
MWLVYRCPSTWWKKDRQAERRCDGTKAWHSAINITGPGADRAFSAHRTRTFGWAIEFLRAGRGWWSWLQRRSAPSSWLWTGMRISPPGPM